MKRDLYQRITADIFVAIEAGAGTFRTPWHLGGNNGTPVNAVSNRPYLRINTLLLWVEASRRGFLSGRWATYRQWTEFGAQVRNRERAMTVWLCKPTEQLKTCNRDGNDGGGRQLLLARAFSVFNADQVDGLQPSDTLLPSSSRINRAEDFFRAQPAATWEGGHMAFYDQRADTISKPSFGAFSSPDAYYSVLVHELTHWSGAKTRLDRDLSGRFGSEAYAMEELIAELEAAFVSGHLQLTAQPRTDHAACIAPWLRVLANDPRAILSASSKAQAAADYLIELATVPAAKVATAPFAETAA